MGRALAGLRVVAADRNAGNSPEPAFREVCGRVAVAEGDDVGLGGRQFKFFDLIEFDVAVTVRSALSPAFVTEFVDEGTEPAFSEGRVDLRNYDEALRWQGAGLATEAAIERFARFTFHDDVGSLDLSLV